MMQVGRRLTGEAEVMEDRIPQEDMVNVPNECNSGKRKKRSADGTENNC